MKHINTIETRDLCESAKKGGCGECRLPASLPAGPAAVLPIRPAKTRKPSKRVLETMMPPLSGGIFSVTKPSEGNFNI